MKVLLATVVAILCAVVSAPVGSAAPMQCSSTLTFLSALDPYFAHSKRSTAAFEADLYNVAFYNARLAEDDAYDLPMPCSLKYKWWRRNVINAAVHYTKACRSRMNGDDGSALYHLKRARYYLDLISTD